MNDTQRAATPAYIARCRCCNEVVAAQVDDNTRYGELADFAYEVLSEGFTTAARVLAEVGYSKWSQLPIGSVIAVARLKDVIPTTSVESLNDQERAFGDFSPGRYAWQLEDVRRLEEPISVAGMQGLWNWDVPAELRSMLGV